MLARAMLVVMLLVGCDAGAASTEPPAREHTAAHARAPTHDDNPPSDNPASDNPASDNPPSDNPASDNPASDSAASDNPASDNPASDNPASDNAASDNPASDTAAGDDGATTPPGQLQNGMPIEWLTCERSADCTFIPRDDASNLCVGHVLPVSRAHLADAHRMHPRRPCPHGPPGHGCPAPIVSCREGQCTARARPPSLRIDDLGL